MIYSIQFLEYSTNIVYDRSGSNTPFDIVNQQKQGAPKNPPMFITVSCDLVFPKIVNFNFQKRT